MYRKTAYTFDIRIVGELQQNPTISKNEMCVSIKTIDVPRKVPQMSQFQLPEGANNHIQDSSVSLCDNDTRL